MHHCGWGLLFPQGAAMVLICCDITANTPTFKWTRNKNTIISKKSGSIYGILL